MSGVVRQPWIRCFGETRRAISLIELLVVMAVSSVLLILTIVSLSRFLAMSRAGRTHLERHLALARLGTQFRRDVWSASDMTEPADKPRLLRLSCPSGEQIEYELDQEAIRRTVLRQGVAESHEAFRLPGVVAAHWEIDPIKPRPRVTLRLELVKGQTDVAPKGAEKPLEIRATLARDQRYVAKREARP
jgi:hypothetical protein